MKISITTSMGRILPCVSAKAGGLSTVLHAPMLLPLGHCRITKVRCWVILSVLATFRTIGGSNPGPEYTTELRQCVNNSECNLAVGEICWWFYDGCPRGQCMCDPRYAYSDAAGQCRDNKQGDEPCEPGDRCPKGMMCTDGRCRCVAGRMTSDRTYCLTDEERMLGQRCHPYHHTCLQRSARGYTTSDVECASYGRCRCREGYKKDRSLCRKWNIGEGGCSKDHECQGGALCVDGACSCPNGYLPVAGNSKCARLGATVELGLGASCDEIGESQYCANHLVCHRCSGQANYVCVHFSDSVDPGLISSSARLKTSHLSSVISLLFSIRLLAVRVPALVR